MVVRKRLGEILIERRLITVEQLSDVELFERHRREALAEHPQLRGRRVLYETIRRMLSAQVYDVIDATRAALEALAPGDSDAVRKAPPVVSFSEMMQAQSEDLKRFLFRNLYRHPQVTQTTTQARQVMRELFEAYLERGSEMPASYAERQDRHRAVADYIAGMTDRFAVREHERLTGRRGIA